MAARQFQQLGLLGLLSQKEAGQPLMLALDSIDEDPAQPRKEFDPESLRELAATIALRGVRQPISVRPHPEKPKRWVLNFGARRLRASILAGKSEIPAFVDATSDSYDQVIENEQRESLKPLEMALFVQRRIEAGDSQAEIARRLGKSRQYITYATGLIDAPDWLLAAYREGRCKGITELYELRKLSGAHDALVQGWVSGREGITREDVAAFRSELKAIEVEDSAAKASTASAEFSLEVLGKDVPVEVDPLVIPPKSSRGAGAAKSTPRSKTTRLTVELEGRQFELITDIDPGRLGEVFVRPPEGGARKCVPVADLRLVGFVTA